MEKKTFFDWGMYAHSKLEVSISYEEFREKQEKGTNEIVDIRLTPRGIRLSSEFFTSQCTTVGEVLNIHTSEGKQIYKYDGEYYELIPEYKSNVGFILSILARTKLHKREYITLEPNYTVKKNVKRIETFFEDFAISKQYLVLEREYIYQVLDPLLQTTIRWIKKEDVLSMDYYSDDEDES